MKRIFFFPILLLITAANTLAQTDSALITALIKDIAASQHTQDGEFYKGMFPGYRKCEGFPHNYQPDNNIFFSAITAFTLKALKPQLNGGDLETVQKIVQNTALAYPYYRNQNGNPYFSFWPANAYILPHAYFINRFNGILAQGDDADDSVMILLASDNNDSDNTALKKRLIQVSNLKKRKINSTFRKYRNIPAYCTYLGEKMHPDFDFAVQCNILYFNFEKKMPLLAEDSATVFLLSEILKNREYMKRPAYISPSYVRSSVLIYHISRLMGRYTITGLDQYKEQLVEDAARLLSKATDIMDRIILRTSLLRLGANPPELKIGTVADFEKTTDQNAFVFFQARAAFAQPTPIKQIFLHWNYLIYSFYCPTYNKALWLEYLVLKSRVAQKSKQLKN